MSLKVLVHPIMKILSLITHPHVVPNPQDRRSSSEHRLRYFWWNLRALRPSIDSKGPSMIKAQKRSKEIGKIIQNQGFNRNFTKLREYFLYVKKTKIMTLFNSLSPLRQRSAILDYIRGNCVRSSVSAEPRGYIVYVYLRFDLNENSASGMRLTQKIVRSFHPADILQNGARVTQRRRIWIKSLFFFFCAQKVFS